MKFAKTLLAAFLLAGCNQTQPKPSASTPPTKQDILVADLDTSVNPGDDFFRYANGGWLNRNPIPASEATWGIGNLVREELHVQLRTINETAAHKKASPGTDEQKIGDF
jgi:putative endopeptidase